MTRFERRPKGRARRDGERPPPGSASLRGSLEDGGVAYPVPLGPMTRLVGAANAASRGW